MQEMLKCSVLLPCIAISYSHKDLELEMTLEAARKSLLIYKDALDSGIGDFLEGREVKPVFRRYN